MNIQVVNVTHPYSTRNSCLIAVFKAGDSPANLHTALDQYRKHIEELQGMKWRFVISKIIIVLHRNGILSLIQRLDNTTLLYWGLRLSLHHVWTHWCIR